MPGTPVPLEALFLRFGLPTPTGISVVDRGLLNRSYQVISAGQTYFLKHYLPWRGPGSGLPDEHGRQRTAAQTLRWQHEAVIRLEAPGIPAVAPLRDLRRRTVTHRRGSPLAAVPRDNGVHRYSSD